MGTDADGGGTAPRPRSDAAETMLAKLRAFASSALDDDERPLLAALLAPGVARAYARPEVEGFGLPGWAPADLPGALADAVRDRNLRIVDGVADS